MVISLANRPSPEDLALRGMTGHGLHHPPRTRHQSCWQFEWNIPRHGLIAPHSTTNSEEVSTPGPLQLAGLGWHFTYLWRKQTPPPNLGKQGNPGDEHNTCGRSVGLIFAIHLLGAPPGPPLLQLMVRSKNPSIREKFQRATNFWWYV